MKIRPEIFLEAAEWMERLGTVFHRHGCCSVLILVNANKDEQMFFLRLFPVGKSTCKKHWGCYSNHTKEQHEARVIALLFCWAEASGE